MIVDTPNGSSRTAFTKVIEDSNVPKIKTLFVVVISACRSHHPAAAVKDSNSFGAVIDCTAMTIQKGPLTIPHVCMWKDCIIVTHVLFNDIKRERFSRAAWRVIQADIGDTWKAITAFNSVGVKTVRLWADLMCGNVACVCMSNVTKRNAGHGQGGT